MNKYPGSAEIVDLRRLLRERFPEAHARTPAPGDRMPAAAGSGGRGAEPGAAPTLVAALDAIGIARGTITEVVSPHPSAGNALLIHGLLHGAAQREHHIALVDGRDAFDPQSAGLQACGRLLWARCRDAAEAVKAADLLLRDGNIGLIAMDLQLNALRELGRIPGSCWHRLRGLAGKSGAALIAFTPQRLISGAHLRVELGGTHTLDSLDTPRENLRNELMIRILKNRTAHFETEQERHLRNAG